MKYFKLDKDKREIIIDKYKKYNVNVDILNLIIDLKCENDRLNNIINELEELLKQMLLDTKRPTILNNFEKNTIRLTIEHIQNKLKELKKGSE